MPLLKREPDLYPRNLFTLSQREHPWWVAYVRSRQEKALARYASSHGIAFYLPQVEQRIRRSGRWFRSFLPLFPGYIFFRGSRQDRRTSLGSDLIVEILEVTDQEQLERELLQLHSLQRAGATLVPLRDVAPGDPVRITEGPFRGYAGVVLREKGKLRLIVAVSMLRRAVAVEFDRQVLAPARVAGAVRPPLRQAV